MRCSKLNELPPPPPDKTGWPWTRGSPQLPDTMRDGTPWPRISIVTPSYNQGQFIEETIRSVLLQYYPNLEYIVVDGGSTDNSIEIIKKYESWLSYWVSESDRGQSHGINKGFEKATGEVFGWINSDDYFHPNGLRALMTFRQSHLDAVAWVGVCGEVDINGVLLNKFTPIVGSKIQIGDWGRGAVFYQPSCFFSAKAFRAVGGLDERLQIALDVDLWLRLAELGHFVAVGEMISLARLYPEIKSLRDPVLREIELIAINWKNCLTEVAKIRLLQYSNQLIKVYPYRDLAKTFVKRTLKGIWGRIFSNLQTHTELRSLIL